MLRSSGLIPGAVAYPTLPSSIAAEQDVVATELMALVTSCAGSPSAPVLLSGAGAAAARPSRLHRRVGFVIGVALRAVRDLLLPHPAAFDRISDVALPGANVKMRRVHAGRVVAMMAGILNARLLADKGSATQVPQQPSVSAVFPPCGVEDTISTLVSAARPKPALIVSPAFDLGPEAVYVFSGRHGRHSRARAVPMGGVSA
jgi:hypothetical protein